MCFPAWISIYSAVQVGFGGLEVVLQLQDVGFQGVAFGYLSFENLTSSRRTKEPAVLSLHLRAIVTSFL